MKMKYHTSSKPEGRMIVVSIMPSVTVTFTILLLQSVLGITIALLIPLQWKFEHRNRRSEGSGPLSGRIVCPNKYCSYTNIRLGATANEGNDTPEDAKTIDIKNIAISDKIRRIFEEGDLSDDEYGDDSFFDDLFLTDEEDGDYSDDSSFVEGEPMANLNEDDLMELHEVYPDIQSPSIAEADSSSNASILSSATSSPTNNTATIPSIAKDEKIANEESDVATDLSLENILSSLETDLSYFYLRDELGLSEDVMWKITNQAPSVLGLKAKNVRNKVQVLQSLVGFTDDEMRYLITSQPNLLNLSVKKNLSPTILSWIRQLEMGKKDLKALILGCPALLKYSRANIHGKLVFFQTTMGYSISDCRKLLVKDPRLLRSSVKTGLLPRLNFLRNEVEISLSDVRKLVLKNPRVLLMNVEQNLTSKCIFYFIMTLHMETKDVGKMLLKYPRILDYNLEHHILPIHHYFMSLDFSTQEFSRILQRYPRLVTYSLLHIKRRIGYLRFELSLEANAIRRILHQSPQIVSLGQENLEETVEFLLQAVAPGASLVHRIRDDGRDSNDEKGHEIVDTSNGEIVDTDDRDALTIVQIIITGLPTLLPLSISNNLEPKVNYLRERLGQEELSNALLRMPALLGYSLENRIRPRLEAILKSTIPGAKLTTAITFKEDDFNEWLEKQIKKRTGVSEGDQVESCVDGSPTIDQAAGNKTREMNESKITSAILEDVTEIDMDKGNGRVVEEGGKIIHWRR